MKLSGKFDKWKDLSKILYSFAKPTEIEIRFGSVTQFASSPFYEILTAAAIPLFHVTVPDPKSPFTPYIGNVTHTELVPEIGYDRNGSSR